MDTAVSWLYAEPLADVIYRKLRQNIGDGIYEPGTRLVQNQVAEELGVSRTPVREALQRLAQDGYADRVHGRGYVVRAASVTEISHVYQVRGQLEPLAVRLAFEHYSVRDRAEFRRLAEATAGRRERDGEYFETNRAFHLALVSPCPNPILVSMIEGLWDLPVNRMISQRVVSARRDPSAWRDEHFAIVAAIDADDAELTVKLMERHLRDGLDPGPSAGRSAGGPDVAQSSRTL
jgi:DNA-binding GntR family transcriptional regulator